VQGPGADKFKEADEHTVILVQLTAQDEAVEDELCANRLA
jgi:hypothetical protein